jgi:hypothetical protein
MIVAFLTVSAAALCAAWLLHILLWRVRLPSRQLMTLLSVFSAVWVLASVWILLSPGSFGLGDRVSAAGFIYFGLLYWSAALCYVITYSAMEGDSPTLSLTRHLHRTGQGGVPHEEIEEFFRQRPFVGARVTALVADGVLVEEGSGYRLSSGRYLFFRVILGYRRFVFGQVKAGG